MRRIDLKKCKRQYFLLVMAILCTFAAVFVRLAWIQLYRGKDLQAQAGEQMKLYLQNNTPRGRIVDREGEELAVSVMVGTLTCDPFIMKDDDRKKGDTTPERDLKRLSADLLGPIVGVPKEELYRRFTTPESRFQYIKRMMTPEEVKACRRVIKDNDLKGFFWQEESQRYYTKGRLAAHILGFVGTDDKGLAGIEQELDEELHGKPYKRSIVYDALGHQLLGGSGSKLDGWKLSTVYLTIDSKMQSVLEESMDTAIEKTRARGAAAIIMDPTTGEILAMTSRPTFDPNEYDKHPESWFNKAVAMNYEPGSVFKPIVGCMGLSEGLINSNTLINDTGRIAVADSVISNWDGEGMGLVPFSEVIKFSINTGMVQLGEMLGGEKEMSYAKKFGFGSATGIELPGEGEGILFGDGSEMYPTEIATVAIGQGIAVTPLQVIRAISSIANGGELLQPYIVKKIVGPDGKVLKENHKKVVRRVISDKVAAEMRGMMEQVVASGGGKTARIKGYRIAGKTGTAEKIADGGGYIEGVYIASFVGFVPADRPRYTMLVMLDSPQGAFYGSQVAAPVFRDTLQQILTAKGIMPSTDEELPSFEVMDGKVAAKSNVRPIVTLLDNGKVKLPNFMGADMRTSAEVLQTGHLRMKPYGSGIVYSQRPAPGTVLDEHSIVELWFK